MANEPEDIARLHAVLFDPKADIRLTYDVHDGQLTITADVASPDPPGYQILAQVTVPDPNVALGSRIVAAMFFFPQEIERAAAMLGEEAKLTFSKDGKDLTPAEFGRALRNELHGKKN